VADQSPFPGIYRRPGPPKRRWVWWTVIAVLVVIVVGILIGSLIRGHNSATLTTGTTSTVTTVAATSTTTSTGLGPQTPTDYASRACSVFDSADLYAFPHNQGELTTARNIYRLADLADRGDDATYGALAADASILVDDISSLSGGHLGDGPDTTFSDECNSLVQRGAIH